MAIDKNKIIEAATRFVQKGQYDKAIKEYQKLLDADPRDARIQQKLGELFQKKGDNLLAAECFLKVAENYSADGFFLKAVAVYKQALKLNPALVDVNLKLAELHQQLGLMSDAMAAYQLVANHYEKSGNIRASLDTLGKMVELDPDNVASRIKLAELYARESMSAEAIGELKHAAEYLKKNNRSDEYVKVAERLVFLDPSNIPLTRELANLYLTKQDPKRALAKLQLCFKADPKDVETLTMLTQAFKGLGQFSKTVSVYKELAKIYGDQGRAEDERSAWQAVLELAPDDPDVRAHLQPAKPSAAVPEAAVPPPAPATTPPPGAGTAIPAPSRLLPSQIPKLLTETDVYVKYGLHEKALEHLRKIFAIDPDSIDAHEKAADLLAATQDAAGASESLVRVVKLCLAKNDLERARANLRKLSECAPRHPELAHLVASVGNVEPAEDVAEIGDDAIVVEAPEVAVEVVAEPASPDLEAEVATAEPLVEVVPEFEGITVTAVGAGNDEPLTTGDDFAQAIGPHDDVASSMIKGDELALACAERSVELVEPDIEPLPPDVEAGSFGLPEHYLDAEPDDPNPSPSPPAAAAEPLSRTTPRALARPGVLIRGPGVSPAGSRVAVDMDGGDADVHESATRITHLPSSISASASASQPHGATPSPSRLASKEPGQASVIPPARSPDASASLDGLRPPSTMGAPARSPGQGHVLARETKAVEPVPPPELEAEQASDELDEAEFFIEQKMLEEAREIVETVLLAYPGSKRGRELLERLEDAENIRTSPDGLTAELESLSAQPGESEAASSADTAKTDGGFDLAAELAKEDLSGLGEPAPSLDDFQYSVDDVFDEFKKGLRKLVKPEDVDTHYDLGIAYKEMGLLDDAIGEFEQAAAAAAGKRKETESLAMVGVCRAERSELPAAVEAFQRALALPQVAPETAKAIHFELASAFEVMGRLPEALGHYLKVQKIDPSFRDISTAVQRMKDACAVEDPTEVTSCVNNASLAPNGFPVKFQARADLANRPDSAAAPKGVNDPKGAKSRKIGYV